MSLQEEVLLERLVGRYERRFGAPPALPSTDLDCAIAFVRAAMEQPLPSPRPTAALEPARADS
jgi:hypothetical protein